MNVRIKISSTKETIMTSAESVGELILMVRHKENQYIFFSSFVYYWDISQSPPKTKRLSGQLPLASSVDGGCAIFHATTTTRSKRVERGPQLRFDTLGNGPWGRC